MGMTSYRSRYRSRAEALRQQALQAKADREGATDQESPSDEDQEGGES